MKPKFKLFKSARFLLGLLVVVFVSSCGSSYENVSTQNDGIYATDDIANNNTQDTSENSAFYENYFDQQDQLISQARSQNEVFTDIDSYSSQGTENTQQDDIIIDENQIQHQSYGGWGTQPTSVSINVIDNSFGPWGGFGPGWGWGAYGPSWGWGGFGPGWGWGGFYGNAWGAFGPGWGWGAFGPGWGWGAFGPGWGYNNVFFGFSPFGYGYPYSSFYLGGNRYAGLAYHYNYRNQSLAFNNRGRSNFDSRARSNRNFRRNSINNRSRSSALRSNRTGRVGNVDVNGRRIRNSRNVNARARSNRPSERNITNTSRTRSGYYNRSIRNNNNSNSRGFQRSRSSSNNRSYTPRTRSNSRSSTRSSGSSSRVRSSGSRSSSSGSSSSGRSSSRRGGRG